MKTSLYLAPLCAAVIALSGCGTQTIKPQYNSLVERSIPKPLTVQGETLLKQAMEQEDVDTLREAARLLQQAHYNQPDDVNIQLTLYQALYGLSAIDGVIAPELRQLYDAADPGIRSSLVPPSSLEVAKRLQVHPSRMTDEDRRWFLQLLKESPSNYQGWAGLASYELYHGHLWTGLVASQRMLQLQPDTVPLYANIARQMESLADEGGCRYDRAPLLRSAANYYSQAAAKSDNTEYYELAAELYLSSGQYPLAYITAQKVMKSEGPDSWRRELVIDAATNLRKLEEVRRLSQEQISEDDETAGHFNLALVAMMEGDKASAAEHFSHYVTEENGKPFTLAEYLRDWLYRLGGFNGSVAALEDSSVTEEWHKELVAVIEQGKSGAIDSDALLKQTINGCQRSEAHFYLAYLFWLQGDIAQAKSHLKATSEQKAYQYIEHEWADALYQQL